MSQRDMMNWSSYQDRQLDVLISLEKSFNSSLSISDSLKNNLTSLQSAMSSIVNSAKSLSSYVGNLSPRGNRSTSNSRANREAMEARMRNLEELHQTEMRYAQEVYEKNMEYLEEQLKNSRKELEESLERRRNQEEADADHKKAMDYIFNKVVNILTTVGKEADNYSAISNQLIKLSGEGGNAVSSFRNDLMSIISDLNADTGGLYNSQESYKTLVSISQTVTGNLDALKEMSRPLLLAEETLDVNLNNIGTLFNRFYSRYSFSSMAMETMINDIRSSSAGNQATANDIIDTLSSISPYLEMMANGDTNKLSEMSDSISKLVSYYSSSGANTTFIKDLIKDLSMGTNINDNAMYFSKSGMMDYTTAKNIITSGNTDMFDEVIKAYVAGRGAVGKEQWNSGGFGDLMYGGKAEENFEFNRIFEYMKSNSFDDFEATRDSTSAADIAEDKYVSAADKIRNNWLEKIYEKFADFQEWSGWGASDVAKLLGLIASIKAGQAILSKGNLFGGGGEGGGALNSLQSIGGRAVANPASGRIAGSLSRLGSMGGGAVGGAMTIGGVAAGIGLGIDGASSAIDDIKQGDVNFGTVASGAQAGMGLAGAGFIAANMTNPIGWGLLVGAGVAKLTKSIYDSVTSYKLALAKVEEEFTDAKMAFKDEVRAREDILLQVEENLKDEDLVEKARRDLIESGLLSEEDKQKAEKASIEQLKELTDAYMVATKQFSSNGEAILDSYEKIVREDTKDIMKDLKKWYSDNKNDKDSTAVLEEMAYAVHNSLQGKQNLTKDEEEFLEKWQKYQSGGFTRKEYENLLDIGQNFSLFESNVAGVDLSQVVRRINNAGGDFAEYSYVDPTAFVNSMNAIITAGTKEEAEKALLNAKKAGITKDYYNQIKGELGKDVPQLEETLEKWGLSFAKGTNYVPEDMPVLVHKGEAIVPEEYNPALNNADISELASEIRSSQIRNSIESEESIEYLEEFVSVLVDIRKFLKDWRNDSKKKSNKSYTNSLMNYLQT